MLKLILPVQLGRKGAFDELISIKSKEKFEKSQELVFNTIKDKISSLKQSETFEDVMTEVMTYNSDRLRQKCSQKTKARLEKREKDLESVKTFFKSNPDKKFLGFVGWGRGCINSTLVSKQNVSAVDGFLYQDDKGAVHYQRLGSCLENFMRFDNPKKGSIVITDGGVDINFKTKNVIYENDALVKASTLFCSKIDHSIAAISKQCMPLQSKSEEKVVSSPFAAMFAGQLNSSKVGRAEEVRTVKTPYNVEIKEIKKSSLEYKFQKVSHGNHSHDKLRKLTEAEIQEKEKNMMIPGAFASKKKKTPTQPAISNNIQAGDIVSEDGEGCVCCNTGLDFDEFAAAIKILLSADKEEMHLFDVADLGDGGHWGIMGPSLIMAIIGLTASYRNIKGSVDNLEKLNKALEKIEDKIKQSHTKEVYEAWRLTLKYSILDTKFNLIVPGVVNGLASASIVIAAFVHHPFALPLIGAYELGQAGRNFYDLNRMCQRPHLGAIEGKKGVYSTFFENQTFDQLENIDNHQLGQLSSNNVTQQQKWSYGFNGTNFMIFTAGAVLTMISLPTIPLGIGALGLPVGLGLLGYGAFSTGVCNNIIPRVFKPRNGDLGVDRETLKLDNTLEEIGKRTKKIKLLSETYDTHLSSLAGSSKKFFYNFLTSMPGLNSSPQRWIHSFNKNVFNGKIEIFKTERDTLLNKLLQIEGKQVKVKKGDFNSHWSACQELGIDGDILDMIIEEEEKNIETSSHSKVEKKDGCCSGSGGELRSKLQAMNLIPSVHSHSDTVTLNETELQKYEKYIDFYLSNKYKEKLKYQKYGLIDFYYALRQVPSDQSSENSIESM